MARIQQNSTCSVPCCGPTAARRLARTLIPVRSIRRIALFTVQVRVYPRTGRPLVLLRRFVSSHPVPLGIPPQPGKSKIQVLGRLVAQHRVTKLLQIHENSLPSRNQARQDRLLPFDGNKTRKQTKSSCSYFFLFAGSLYRRGVTLESPSISCPKALSRCSPRSMFDICIR